MSVVSRILLTLLVLTALVVGMWLLIAFVTATWLLVTASVTFAIVTTWAVNGIWTAKR